MKKEILLILLVLIPYANAQKLEPIYEKETFNYQLIDSYFGLTKACLTFNISMKETRLVMGESKIIYNSGKIPVFESFEKGDNLTSLSKTSKYESFTDKETYINRYCWYREPDLGFQSSDLIPVFDTQAMGEYAWWNNSYYSCNNFTITNSDSKVHNNEIFGHFAGYNLTNINLSGGTCEEVLKLVNAPCRGGGDEIETLKVQNGGSDWCMVKFIIPQINISQSIVWSFYHGNKTPTDKPPYIDLGNLTELSESFNNCSWPNCDGTWSGSTDQFTITNDALQCTGGTGGVYIESNMVSKSVNDLIVVVDYIPTNQVVGFGSMPYSGYGNGEFFGHNTHTNRTYITGIPTAACINFTTDMPLGEYGRWIMSQNITTPYYTGYINDTYYCRTNQKPENTTGERPTVYLFESCGTSGRWDNFTIYSGMDNFVYLSSSTATIGLVEESTTTTISILPIEDECKITDNTTFKGVNTTAYINYITNTSNISNVWFSLSNTTWEDNYTSTWDDGIKWERPINTSTLFGDYNLVCYYNLTNETLYYRTGDNNPLNVYTTSTTSTTLTTTLPTTIPIYGAPTTILTTSTIQPLGEISVITKSEADALFVEPTTETDDLVNIGSFIGRIVGQLWIILPSLIAGTVIIMIVETVGGLLDMLLPGSEVIPRPSRIFRRRRN